MGIALGLGIIIGVRAAFTGNELLLIPLATILALLAGFNGGWPRRLLVGAACGCVLGGMVGVWRMPQPTPDVLDLGQREFNGRLVGDPRAGAQGQVARLAWTDLQGVERESLALLPLVPAVGRGDGVTVYGDLYGPRAEVVFADALRLDERAGRLDRARRNIRAYISDTAQEHAPGSPGALVLGLLIGDDSRLTATEREDLRRSGLSHITAVSGWNVTVVVTSIGALFLAMALRGWPWITLQLAGLTSYVWIVGIEPPVLRAALMGATALVALQLGRPAHMLTLLSLAAATMVLISPATIGSLSFQLSVLSMLGLLAAARLDSALATPLRALVVPVAASGAAGLATAPLLALRFGAVSLATIPANVVVSPLIPAATWSGIVLVLVGWLPWVGALVGTLTWALCSLVLWMSAFFANLPSAYVQLVSPSAGVVVLLYLALAVVLMPFLPEGRLLLRRLQRWYEGGPLRASAALASLAAVLGIALFAV